MSKSVAEEIREALKIVETYPDGTPIMVLGGQVVTCEQARRVRKEAKKWGKMRTRPLAAWPKRIRTVRDKVKGGIGQAGAV